MRLPMTQKLIKTLLVFKNFQIMMAQKKPHVEEGGLHLWVHESLGKKTRRSTKAISQTGLNNLLFLQPLQSQYMKSWVCRLKFILAVIGVCQTKGIMKKDCLPMLICMVRLRKEQGRSS